MQHGTPHPNPRGPTRKCRIDCKSGAEKTNTTEPATLFRIDGNSQLFKRRQAIGHQAFAAGLVNGRLSAVGHSNAESLLPRCNCHRHSRGTATNHKHICRVHQLPDLTTLEEQVLNKNPAPWRPARPACPLPGANYS